MGASSPRGVAVLQESLGHRFSVCQLHAHVLGGGAVGGAVVGTVVVGGEVDGAVGAAVGGGAVGEGAVGTTSVGVVVPSSSNAATMTSATTAKRIAPITMTAIR